MTSKSGKQTTAIGNQSKNLGQLIELNMKKI